MKAQLLEKIKNKTAKVGIIGLGYVGLPLMIRYADEGYSVLGFDVDTMKIKSINEKQSYIRHIPSEKMQSLPSNCATSDFSKINLVDAIIICVPTPLNKYKEPDISYITGSMEQMLPHLKKGQIISLESTTYPGTTEEEIVSRLQKRGFKVGEDFFVVFSPEREDPANPHFSTKSIPKVCGGHTDKCQEIGVALYSVAIDKVVSVSSTRAAEMTKLLENIHRAVNIGLVNEMKIVADKMGIDIYEVIKAASTKPFGFTPYYPGPGLGGHCIPIDPFYLTWKAKEYGVHTHFIELAGEINHDMPKYVVEKIVLALNSIKKSINNSKILILGMAYKKNVDDYRESPSLEVISQLNAYDAEIFYSDPFFMSFPAEQNGIKLSSNSSVELSESTLKKFDLVALLTDHDSFNLDLIANHANLIVDTRGKFKSTPKVFKA